MTVCLSQSTRSGRYTPLRRSSCISLLLFFFFSPFQRVRGAALPLLSGLVSTFQTTIDFERGGYLIPRETLPLLRVFNFISPSPPSPRTARAAFSSAHTREGGPIKAVSLQRNYNASRPVSFLFSVFYPVRSFVRPLRES